jgi:uncharacterized membrane protein YhaH (DUF805 family)
MQWYLEPWRRYAQFNGRARRTEYWTFVLVNAVISGILSCLDFDNRGFLFWVGSAFGLATLIPTLAVVWRRLHDSNRSGGWFFIAFIPLIGWIWLLVLLLLGGTPGANRFGPDPRQLTA